MTKEPIGTYEPWQSLPEAQERIAELERENARLLMLNERIAHDELMVQQANESLRKALVAVPVESISVLVEGVRVDNWTRKPLNAVKRWLKTQAVQP